MSEWVAVMAGTPIDTQMGINVLAKKDIPCRGYAMAADPTLQTAFQHKPEAEKMHIVREVLEGARSEGCEKVFVYCNSLSGAVDFDRLTVQTGMQIVTPLMVYRRLAKRYMRLAVIAANASGLLGIERTFYAENPALKLLGTTLLPVVNAIESGMPPEDIVSQFGLCALTDWFAQTGMEALILGCTHFPYFKEALEVCVRLPLIDPADEMTALLLG